MHSRQMKQKHYILTTGAKPALGPNCLIPYINDIIQFGPKAGLAPVILTIQRSFINVGKRCCLPVIVPTPQVWLPKPNYKWVFTNAVKTE